MMRSIGLFGRPSWVAGLAAVALAGCHSTTPATPRTPVTPATPAMLLSSATGGPGMLGELTRLPLQPTGRASTFHGFAGTPWIGDAWHDGHGLVWNSADNRFYGVLNGGGAYRTGVLLAFDPATDDLTLLKTLSGREYPAKAGLAGDMLPFRKADGFYRKPLLTPDGKGLLLLSTAGGVDHRGLLIHVNIDPASASYLDETIVYDFFDYEVAQISYCDSLRAEGVEGETELAWGKDALGHDVVFMGRVGLDYTVDPYIDHLAEPGTCDPYSSGGMPHDRIKGRMFALRPSDPGDLSKPWGYSLGQGPALDPLLNLGRQIHWDARRQAIRWATEEKGGGMLSFFSGASSGSTSYWGATEQGYRLGGLLPLDANSGSIATFSGLNGSDTTPDSPPRIFKYTSNDLLDQKAVLGGWYADKKFFRGTASSLLSRRLFANGGYYVDDCFEDSIGCTAPSTIEELDPVLGYPQQVLVTGSRATTGQFFFGDPGVGGSIREPIADRYLAWFGAEVDGFSNTLSKYDRLTDQTVTIQLDPVAGAYPKGRLLDLGDGTALGFMEATPPPGGAAVSTRPGGYAGNGTHQGSRPGYYLIDLNTGAVASMFRNSVSMASMSLEQVRLDDGSVWVAYGEYIVDPSYWRVIDRLDPSTGVRTNHAYKQEEWNYEPADAYALAGRRSAALYLPFWKASVDPFSKHHADVTLGCVRADDGAVVAHSDVFGPASAASGSAHRIVYGATYSPAQDAMYLATSKVAGADQGTIFEIDKGVADAALCTAKPVVTALVTGLTDVPSTKPLSTKAGGLFYGTANGKLMRLDVASQTVTLVADLSDASATSSGVRGYLAEVADGVVAAVVHDQDATGKNTARRVVSVDVVTGVATSRDVTALIDEFEPYPGVLRLD
jgi:hypothetical protein